MSTKHCLQYAKYAKHQICRVSSALSILFFLIPNRIKDSDIFKLFGCIGNIVEVVILSKKDWDGKRYGFSRFKGVTDERVFAVRLDNVMIDGKKIHANTHRFVRKSEGMKGVGKVEVRGFSTKVNLKVLLGGKSMFRKGIFLYAEAIDNRAKQQSTNQGESSCCLSFESKKEDLSRLRKDFVGVILSYGMTYNIQSYFDMERYFFYKGNTLRG
ncbi:unnamed protein product [Vicia faba]|uniref:RRM domain-containing protein n=1 Tax=Vicia faba TaxID=3906 RepID=A0AAV0ZC57_VICFA|nr:unnamed protein product [Vicia faba]